MMYSDLLNYIYTALATNPADPDLALVLPDAIAYAENRIFVELDFLHTKITQSTSLSAASRYASLAGFTNNPFIVVEQANVITPAGVSADAGTRNYLTPQSMPYMDAMYTSSAAPSGTQVPVDFAMKDDLTIVVGPLPDQGYGIEVRGTFRPQELSSMNTSTWLATNMPELYFAAVMVRLTGTYNKNYSAASDNQQEPVNWESQYQALKSGRGVEEARKKFQGPGWAPTSTSNVAVPGTR